MELRAVVGENAFGAEGGGAQAGIVLGANGWERFAQVGFARDAAGNVAAGDEEIDQREEGVDSRVEFVEVGDDGNACGARPAGGDGCGGGVVTVEVECVGV